jgi:hypothetical protein
MEIGLRREERKIAPTTGGAACRTAEQRGIRLWNLSTYDNQGFVSFKKLCVYL